jgi:hypothetical protein
MAFITAIMDAVVKAAEVIGAQQQPEVAEVAAALGKLAPPKVGLGGQFQEWKDETTMDITQDGGYPHVNHLSWVWPGNQIVRGRSDWDDALCEGVITTLRTRDRNGGTWGGFPGAWRMGLWARMHEPAGAINCYSGLIARSTGPNLWNGGTFQIDGNMGAIAAFGEMLFQSTAGPLELLPALPADWAAGAVNGARARGNFVVNEAWEGGKLTRAEITSGSGLVATVKYPGIAAYTVTSSTGALNVVRDSDDQIHFATAVGATYTILP